MFSSSGLFANISCPLQKRGLCGRPHCQYKHASELAEMFGTSHKSVDNSPGVHLGVPVTDETTGDCLQELERINKEIETVQHEVEQEQRRLSHYRIIQADSRNTTETSNFSFAKCVAVNKKLDRDTCGHYNCAKGHSQARKYVLDNSKPRTDLEYDPLSNFSADLRSYSSSNNEQKVKNGQGLKREKHATHSARKPSHLYQIPLSRSPSPEHSDPNEEGILIIDISPSPDKKIGQTLTSTNSPVSSFQDTTEKVYCTKNNQDISNVCHNKNCENTSDDGNVIDLTRYSEDGATSPELSDELSHSCIDQLLEETINVDELPHIPVPCSGKMNPMHPQVDHPKKSHFHKTSGAKSFSPYRQCMKQTQKSEQPAQSITDNIWSLNRSLSLVPQKISSRVSGQMQDEDSMDCSSPSHSQRVSAGSLCESQYTLPASNLTRAQLPSESTDLHLMKEDKDVIVIVSSSDEMEELDLSDVDFSDTDPVEECYRIFMEANNEDKGNEEQPVPVATKRKAKQQCETVKVPHDIRQRYVNMFTEEFLKTTANVNDAFEKALTEERTVYNRSVNKLKYLSVAVNALKRLRNQSAAPPKSWQHSTQPRKTQRKRNFPIQCLEKPGRAVLFNDNKKSSSDPFKRICCRCGSTYSVNQTGKHTRKEECTYHYGKGVENRVPGGVETRYSCCEGVMGAPGCQVFKLHVSDSFSLDGFVFTGPRDPSDTSCPGVYSLNCEMCYTIQGLELSRVTVVNPSLQVVYDTFVKPDHEVIDYNTRFSGISEEDVKGNCTSLRNVQETLLSFISADTILIGHGLETDLCVLKLIHGMVVDTSVVFPHRLGPPHKLTLNSLTAEYLRRIIQESVCGHDTAEDAAACMELMLWKAKEDGRLKK
uniref:Zgc:152968 n=1 Tax=Sphaeramia orbicularis TaxID=375764 RepID=A0A673C5E5_9TELE